MTILVVGATGKQFVEQLLIQRHKVKIIVRSPETLPESWKSSENLKIISASILELSDKDMREQVLDCDSIASCLGHNMSWKRIYGHPRKLATNTTRRLCNAIKTNRPNNPIKYVLMNTTSNRNRDLSEPISFGQKCVIWLIRLLVPPHVDNEKAADFLRTQIGQNNEFVEWTIIRPDTLLNEEDRTDYEIDRSPVRSAIFDAGKTSRINVGDFMTNLINDNALWTKWKGQMPVICNKSSLD
jgi:putative NADH-flavin reductase